MTRSTLEQAVCHAFTEVISGLWVDVLHLWVDARPRK